MDALGSADAAVAAIQQTLQLPQHEGGCPPESGRLSKTDEAKLNMRSLQLSLMQPGNFSGADSQGAVLLTHVNGILLPRLAESAQVRDCVHVCERERRGARQHLASSCCCFTVMFS